MTALETLLREKEFDQITVADIAKEASVSTGLLYSHFANKADFLDALLEAYRIRVLTRLEAVENSDVTQEYRDIGDLRLALRSIAAYAYEQLLEDAHILRAISHSLRSHPKNNSQEWHDLRQRAFQTIAPIIDVYESEISRPNNTKTAEMLVYFFNTIFVDSLLLNATPSTNSSSLSQDDFISEITDFAYGYLTTPPPPHQQGFRGTSSREIKRYRNKT